MEQNYFRTETITEANTRLVNFHSQLEWVSVIVSSKFYFSIKHCFVFFRIIWVNKSSTLGVEQDIHWTVIYDLNFNKNKRYISPHVLLYNQPLDLPR
nr:hypothetical protein [Peribacillus simplex]